jgi:hypothetical protein
MASPKSEWKPVWWTTIIVTLTMTILGNLADIVEKRANADAYMGVQTFFRAAEPDYFALLYLLLALIVVFVIVWIYKIMLPQLPSNWIARGIIVGLALFLVADLLNMIVLNYKTVLPAGAVRGMAIAALINKLINGLILAYTYMRFSPDWAAVKPDAAKK